MFDSEFAAVDDAAVVAAIEQCHREEAMAGARRLAAIAELARRHVDDDDDRAFDGWDCASGEVAAAMTVSHRKASAQMRIAIALRDRLPRVAALYWRGALSTRVVSAITCRTRLVEDADAIALIDAAISERAHKWGPHSDQCLDTAIDAVVDTFDRAAVLRTKENIRARDFTVGDMDDPAETTTVWGRLLRTDAEVLKRRMADMLSRLCDHDPRSAKERRSDAAGTIVAGRDHLPCRCGLTTCPASAAPSPPSNVVVHVIAEKSAVEAASSTDREHTTPAPAVMLGRGILPGPLLAEAIRAGAKLRPISTCSESGSGYHPSRALAEFVRMRDLTCRFPGCGVPADRCDIDHTIRYPLGQTHASNLKCLCRKHHLMKTFYTGVGGWGDQQQPDGNIVWTSPSGRTYTTTPGSRLFFPKWDTTTADLPPPLEHSPPLGNRDAMMPKRRRTRAAADAARIKAERARNTSIEAPF
jgi:hypothetical protein